MKKLALLTSLFLAFSFMGIAQEWHGITSDSPVKMKQTLVSSSEKEIVVDVQVGGFYTTNVRTPNGKQVVVSVDDMATMLEAGSPNLPTQDIPVIIGDRAEMKVSVVKSKYVDFENVQVAPSKGNFSRQINPNDVPYTYGEMYQQDAFWPAEQAYLDAPYIIRDFRGQNIMVRPFAYNPVTKTLRVYTDMTIAVTKVSDNGENQKAARKSNTIKATAETKAAYGRRFINFSAASKDYPFITDNGEMLIICPEQYMAGMQPLVDWKNKSGRPTTMVSVAQAGGNVDTQIKSYINNLYNDPAHNLVYVLFVGDYADLTPHVLGNERSDSWFGQLEGTDHYPEVFIGRFSVENDAHVATHVNKVIGYERDVQAGITWGDKGMGIGYYGAGSGHYGEDDYQHIDLIRDTLMHYTYSTITEHHGGSGGDASVTTISNTINEGIGIINYCNHGSETSWGVANYSTSNVHALTNDNMLPIVWSVACLNGKFGYYTECFAEAWLRATDNSTGEPTGAVGGMFSWESQPWIPPMYGQDEMVDILTEWRNPDQFFHTLGGASLNGSMAVIDKSGDTDCHDTWILFGDPSMMVRTANPTDMDVTITPAAPMLGMNTLTIATDAPAGIATLSNQEGEVIASGQLVDGAITLEFEPFNNVGEYDLVILGYNKVTYNGTIEVLPAEGAFITVDAFTPNTVNAVDEQQMSMTFKNVGVDPTEGTTTVVLSSESEDITFIDNDGSFGVLAANETITLDNEFTFTVAAGVPDNTKITIDVTATCGNNVWSGKAKITVGAPIMEFVQFQSEGGFEPGTTQAIAATFMNVGHYKATNVEVTAACSNQYVTIETDSMELGTVDPDGAAMAIFNISVSEACPVTEVLTFDFNLVADNGIVVPASGIIKNSCIIVFALADSYGDGWNGASLHVAFSDGTPTANLTMTSGSSQTVTMEVGMGVHVTLTWSSGSWDSECSFVVSYEGGDQITSMSGPSSSYNFEFDVNCTGGVTPGDPVQNLDAVAEGNTVTLTWEAPKEGTPIAYLVIRNGVEIDEVTELTYVDEYLQWNTAYSYCVVAVYEDVNSMPMLVMVTTGENSVGDVALSTSVYPNPANNVLNIRANVYNYKYQLVNSLGQVVMSGEGAGDVELNVSDLSGMYFLKVIANGNTDIQKVIIK